MKKVSILFLCFLLLTALAACGAPKEAASPEPAVTPTPEPTATPAPTATPTPEPTATPEPTPEPTAPELTGEAVLWDSFGDHMARLLDNDPDTYISYRAGGTLTVESQEPMGAVYLCWFREPGAYTVTADGESFPAGENGFLYEYIALPAPANQVELTVPVESKLSDVRVFGVGAAPADVQVWAPPCEQADVLVFPTHADDDVIFFGALMVDCVERGLDVQVCYMVNHYDTWYGWLTRPQELLNALWEMGIRHYPVIGPFPDHYVMSLEEARAKFGENNVIAYQVEQIRRFRPLVVVGHDRKGEYGHGGHQINSLALEQAVPLAADDTAFPESAERWGLWDTPKLYLHFADENPIMLDVEIPLEGFGGRTAFEVATEAMECHKSQLQYAHRPQLEHEKYTRYDCRRFGLVRSVVGADTGNDIMEHTEGIRES